MRRDPSSLEAEVAYELSAVLEKTHGKLEFELEPSSDLCYMLELYIPQQLSRYYPEWESESLDGILVTSAYKIGAETAELCGVAILISDQAVTPFFISLTLASSRESVASYKIYVGESGGGRLGISGPLYGSLRATRLIELVGERLDKIRWSYMITSGAG